MEEIDIANMAKRSRIAAFGRLAVGLAFVALVALIATGAVDASALEAATASVLAVAGLVLAWWKDNNVTIRAILRHEAGMEIEEESEGE